MKQQTQRMCIVNPMLVEDIAPLIGGQTKIMGRVGISWNSWTKIVGGLPVRQSLGERFRARILRSADELDGLRAKFPAPSGDIDRDALAAAFLLPSVAGANDEDGDWQMTDRRVAGAGRRG